MFEYALFVFRNVWICRAAVGVTALQHSFALLHRYGRTRTAYNRGLTERTEGAQRPNGSQHLARYLIARHRTHRNGAAVERFGAVVGQNEVVAFVDDSISQEDMALNGSSMSVVSYDFSLRYGSS